MRKTFFLVIASRGEIYDKFIFEYWIPFIKYLKQTGKNNLEIFLLFGINVKTDDFNEIKDNILKFECDESGPFGSWTPGILQKTIQGMKYIDDNFEYDYIFRTNLSSFFIYDNFIKIVEKLDNNKVYSGDIAIYDNIPNPKYINGAGFILSNDVVKYLVNNENKLQYHIPDDVAIGILLQEFIDKSLPRLDIHINCFNENIGNQYLNHIISNNHFHIRIKNYNRNFDIMFVNHFKKFFYKNLI